MLGRRRGLSLRLGRGAEPQQAADGAGLGLDFGAERLVLALPPQINRKRIKLLRHVLQALDEKA